MLIIYQEKKSDGKISDTESKLLTTTDVKVVKQ